MFIKKVLPIILIIILLSGLYFLLFKHTKTEEGYNRLMVHNAMDFYSLQAMQWRKGRIDLDDNLDDGEIASYKGKYFLSFPPAPTIPMYILTFIFGEFTPSQWVVMIYNIISFILAYLICIKFKSSPLNAFIGASLACLASNSLFMSISGAVWFMAQLFSLLFTLLAFYLFFKEKDIYLHLAMFSLALAVGARPFQIIYFFFLSYILLKKKDFKIKKILKYYIAPAITGIIYMTYNYIRFDSIFEFGHNYLPEFLEDSIYNHGQFSLKYIPEIFYNVFIRQPTISFKDGISFNEFGFSFYSANVIFILLFIAIIIYITKAFINKEGENVDQVLILTLLMLIHTFLFLMHKTAGGWQFGSRYFVDLIPAALLVILYTKEVLYKKTYSPVILLLSFGIAFNIFGALTIFI